MPTASSIPPDKRCPLPTACNNSKARNSATSSEHQGNGSRGRGRERERERGSQSGFGERALNSEEAIERRRRRRIIIIMLVLPRVPRDSSKRQVVVPDSKKLSPRLLLATVEKEAFTARLLAAQSTTCQVTRRCHPIGSSRCRFKSRRPEGEGKVPEPNLPSLGPIAHVLRTYTTRLDAARAQRGERRA